MSEYPEEFGFRNKLSGVHTSRTMMFDDLQSLVSSLSQDAGPEDYREKIINENVLYKKTHTTRETTAKKLERLYGLDQSIPLFKYFRRLWDKEEQGRELLCCLLANARDPVLRLTASPVLKIDEGEKFEKEIIKSALRKQAGDEFADSTINSTSRNAASTWTQSGHLKGHTKKIRSRPEATSANASYALLLGYFCGISGNLLFDTIWMDLLDVSHPEAFELAKKASQKGYISFKRAGGVVEVGFSQLVDQEDQERVHEQDPAIDR